MISKEIGQRLKEIRISENLTQQQLGDKLSMSNQRISQIESGLNNITLPLLVRMLRAMNHDITIFKTVSRVE